MKKTDYKIPKIPELSTQSGIVKLRSTYVLIKEKKENEIVTQIPVNMYSVSRVVNDIINKLSLFDDKAGTNYSQKINSKQLKSEIETALEKIDPEKTGKLTEENKNRIERAFDVLKREATGTTRIKRVAEKPFVINTIDWRDNIFSNVRISEFQKNKAMIYEKSSADLSKKEDKELIEKAKNEAVFKNIIIVENKYLFKCPLNVVILSHSNEIEFAKYLIKPEYAKHIDAWIKSADRSFYEIPYSLRIGSRSSLAIGGGHQKWFNFNPDFFIKLGRDIIVVEIKADEDISDENKAKLKYARMHFDELNRKQKQQKYYFKFLSPQDFQQFFEKIAKKSHADYQSNLEAELLA